VTIPRFKKLLHGIDTVQCAYYLRPTRKLNLDFSTIAHRKEKLQNSKKKDPVAIKIGHGEFFLQPYGTASGYPFVISNGDFKIEFGQYNTPNFFVTFSSQGLWRESAFLLHDKFLNWANSAGYETQRPEGLSRVDFCFDYHLPEIDFDQDAFVSRSNKDRQFRENKKVQTFCFGKDDVVLRIYDKVAEIKQKSDKVWFYILWGQDSNVWRIEWQVRKPVLRKFGIQTFEELKENQGVLLGYLASEHDTLRKPNNDANSSRWPMHPLWTDLQEQISNLNSMGVSRVYGQNAALDERMTRMGISVLGYLKRIAALRCFQSGKNSMDVAEAVEYLDKLIFRVHESLTWKLDVQKRIKEIELGKW